MPSCVRPNSSVLKDKAIRVVLVRRRLEYWFRKNFLAEPACSSGLDGKKIHLGGLYPSNKLLDKKSMNNVSRKILGYLTFWSIAHSAYIAILALGQKGVLGSYIDGAVLIKAVNISGGSFYLLSLWAIFYPSVLIIYYSCKQHIFPSAFIITLYFLCSVCTMFFGFFLWRWVLS